MTFPPTFYANPVGAWGVYNPGGTLIANQGGPPTPGPGSWKVSYTTGNNGNATSITVTAPAGSTVGTGYKVVVGTVPPAPTAAYFDVVGGAPGLSSLSLSPSSVVCGTGSTGTVTLSGAAPAGGDTVALSSSSGMASVPASVTIPAGSTSTTFGISTSNVAATTSATITGRLASASLTATMMITLPAPPAGPGVVAGNQALLLTWPAAAGVLGYNVYQVAGSSYTKVNTLLVTTPAYLAANLTNGTAYTYAVTSVSRTGAESGYSAPVSATPAAQSGSFTTTYNTVNTPASPSMGGTQAMAFSSQTQLLTLASVFGVQTTAATQQAAASYSGSCTLTWVPSGTPAWPALLVVTHAFSSSDITQAINGTAAGSVTDGSGNLLASVVNPSSQSVQSTPGPTETWTAADSTHLTTVLSLSTTLVQPQTVSGATIGWTGMTSHYTTTTDAYTAAWLQAHFSSPSAISFTYTVTPENATAAASLSNSTASGCASASAMIADTFQGQ